MPFLVATLPFSALMAAFVATLVRSHRGYVAQPSWTAAAAIALAAYALSIIPYLLLLRRQAAGKMGARLVAKGIDPVGFMGLSGMVMFLSPTCIALFLSLVGFPLVHLYITTAYSILGMAIWPLFYRR